MAPFRIERLIGYAAFAATAAIANAQQTVTTDGGTIDAANVAERFPQRSYSPYAGRNYPTRPLWGDQHLHTSWSGDAAASGTTLDPEDSLRFARGEQVVSSTGVPVKLSRPYDWLAVTDHSDAMGTFAQIIAGDPKLMTDPTLKRWNEEIAAGGGQASAVVMEAITLQGRGELPEPLTDRAFAFDAWHKYTSIIESMNDPGRFTALIAYEWTSNYGGGNNLHRNVIYRDGKDKADLVSPLTTFDTENPEELWVWMAQYEERTAGRVLAIPHNGNLSNGLMFALETFEGRRLTSEWALARAQREPLIEITQGKGTSEQHPTLSPTDEFAAFEIWDKGNLNVVPKEPGMIPREYAREALKNGLMLEADFGTNPFKFGFAGGTDAHTGLSTTEENNFFGKFPQSEPSVERATGDAFNFEGRTIKDWQLGASGLTAVWATENTRTAIWDAMMRKEVYATTGTRIGVRFFGGFEFTADDAVSREPASIGYRKGVPMGGDLTSAPPGRAPSFLVAALKDPLSGNLDRIQIIKGWLDAEGNTQERIYDVAVSDGRPINADGRASTPVGNTVDPARAIWTNTIGDPELIAVWTDPDFDPELRAFYYARVIEIPTPRWNTYDSLRLGSVFPPETPTSIQERAYTSPIWYTP
jgi:hypothetical protein